MLDCLLWVHLTQLHSSLLSVSTPLSTPLAMLFLFFILLHDSHVSGFAFDLDLMDTPEVEGLTVILSTFSVVQESCLTFICSLEVDNYLNGVLPNQSHHSEHLVFLITCVQMGGIIKSLLLVSAIVFAPGEVYLEHSWLLRERFQCSWTICLLAVS